MVSGDHRQGTGSGCGALSQGCACPCNGTGQSESPRSGGGADFQHPVFDDVRHIRDLVYFAHGVVLAAEVFGGAHGLVLSVAAS